MYQNPFISISLVLLLGMRHGLDADHLAAINAIVQNISSKLPSSKLIGFFFALGHGMVVTLISILIGIGLNHAIPNWFDDMGNFISAFFLLSFGLINLFSLVKKSSPKEIPKGIKSLFVKKVTHKINHPISICCVGALFALSFDTFTQAAVFSLSACAVAGWLFNGALGMVFTMGMIMADGLNGWLMAKLIHLNRSGKLYAMGSHVINIIITLSSLTVGGLNAIKLLI